MPSTDLGYMTATLDSTGAPYQEHPIWIGSHDLVISMNGYPNDHPFEVVKGWMSGATVDYSALYLPNGWHEYRSNWPTSAWDNRQLPYLAPADLGALASSLIAGTNPTRPDVLVPNFLFELKDMPMMLKDAGDLLLGGLKPSIRKRNKKNLSASQYLAYNFGWAPLISDVKKLFDFTENVKKRTSEWNRVYSSGGLKRRYKLGTEEADSTYVGDSYYHGNFTVSAHISRTSWGTVRWRPVQPRTGAPSRPTPEKIRRLVLGLSAENISANIWQSLPWSWFVDWFTNFGNMLVANGGRDSVLPESINVMLLTQGETKVPYAHVSWTLPWVGGSTRNSGGFHYVKKERHQLSASLSANVGILSPHQLSILSSLALLRAR